CAAPRAAATMLACVRFASVRPAHRWSAEPPPDPYTARRDAPLRRWTGGPARGAALVARGRAARRVRGRAPTPAARWLAAHDRRVPHRARLADGGRRGAALQLPRRGHERGRARRQGRRGGGPARGDRRARTPL